MMVIMTPAVTGIIALRFITTIERMKEKQGEQNSKQNREDVKRKL